MAKSYEQVIKEKLINEIIQRKRQLWSRVIWMTKPRLREMKKEDLVKQLDMLQRTRMVEHEKIEDVKSLIKDCYFCNKLAKDKKKVWLCLDEPHKWHIIG